MIAKIFNVIQPSILYFVAQADYPSPLILRETPLHPTLVHSLIIFKYLFLKIF